MIIGFTGTRKGLTEYQREKLRELIHDHECTRFLHGDCVGADGEAHDIVRGFHNPIYVVIHPAIVPANLKANKKGDLVHKPKPPLVRNHDIVDDCEVLFACPGEHAEQLRSGTWATVRYARRIGRPIITIYPGKK